MDGKNKVRLEICACNAINKVRLEIFIEILKFIKRKLESLFEI